MISVCLGFIVATESETYAHRISEPGIYVRRATFQ
jgi:hypothetical protein